MLPNMKTTCLQMKRHLQPLHLKIKIKIHPSVAIHKRKEPRSIFWYKTVSLFHQNTNKALLSLIVLNEVRSAPITHKVLLSKHEIITDRMESLPIRNNPPEHSLKTRDILLYLCAMLRSKMG